MPTPKAKVETSWAIGRPNADMWNLRTGTQWPAMCAFGLRKATKTRESMMLRYRPVKYLPTANGPDMRRTETRMEATSGQPSRSGEQNSMEQNLDPMITVHGEAMGGCELAISPLALASLCIIGCARWPSPRFRPFVTA